MAKWRRIAFVLMLSSLIFSVLGLLHGGFSAGRYDTGTQMFDSNDVAFVEVSLLSFGLAVLLGSFGAIVKVAALSSVLVSVLLALYTGSRGGLLGLAAVFLMFMSFRLPRVTKLHKLIIMVFVGVAIAMNMDKLNTDRYQTITNLGDDYNSFDELGRVQLWSRGLRLLIEDPLTGVGANEFPEAIGKMRAREGLLEQWQAPHNSYIEILVETGIVGGVAFPLLIITCIGTFNDLRRRKRPSADRELQVLPGVLLIGFVGQLVGASFLSQAYSIFFTLSFAASASLRGISASSSDEARRAHN
jgi:O-antigen ligase